MALAPLLASSLHARCARWPACGAARGCGAAAACDGNRGCRFSGARFGRLAALRLLLVLGVLGVLGLRRRLRFWRFALGLRLRLFLLRADQVAFGLLVRLEVGLVPARALQAEYRHRDQLLEGTFAAGGATGERRIADLLHHLGVVLAGFALVFVKGHELSWRLMLSGDYNKARPGDDVRRRSLQPRAARRSSAL